MSQNVRKSRKQFWHLKNMLKMGRNRTQFAQLLFLNFACNEAHDRSSSQKAKSVGQLPSCYVTKLF